MIEFKLKIRLRAYSRHPSRHLTLESESVATVASRGGCDDRDYTATTTTTQVQMQLAMPLGKFDRDLRSGQWSRVRLPGPSESVPGPGQARRVTVTVIRVTVLAARVPDSGSDSESERWVGISRSRLVRRICSNLKADDQLLPAHGGSLEPPGPSESADRAESAAAGRRRPQSATALRRLAGSHFDTPSSLAAWQESIPGKRPGHRDRPGGRGGGHRDGGFPEAAAVTNHVAPDLQSG
jgi:hypothetical protein